MQKIFFLDVFICLLGTALIGHEFQNMIHPNEHSKSSLWYLTAQNWQTNKAVLYTEMFVS